METLAIFQRLFLVPPMYSGFQFPALGGVDVPENSHDYSFMNACDTDIGDVECSWRSRKLVFGVILTTEATPRLHPQFISRCAHGIFLFVLQLPCSLRMHAFCRTCQRYSAASVLVWLVLQTVASFMGCFSALDVLARVPWLTNADVEEDSVLLFL